MAVPAPGPPPPPGAPMPEFKKEPMLEAAPPMAAAAFPAPPEPSAPEKSPGDMGPPPTPATAMTPSAAPSPPPPPAPPAPAAIEADSSVSMTVIGPTAGAAAVVAGAAGTKMNGKPGGKIWREAVSDRGTPRVAANKREKRRMSNFIVAREIARLWCGFRSYVDGRVGRRGANPGGDAVRKSVLLYRRRKSGMHG
ncbi:basic proline-rich protein [Gracilaria domingensis]|nr:basic proline-rich protein [Gracilaria domingensis]